MQYVCVLLLTSSRQAVIGSQLCFSTPALRSGSTVPKSFACYGNRAEPPTQPRRGGYAVRVLSRRYITIYVSYPDTRYPYKQYARCVAVHKSRSCLTPEVNASRTSRQPPGLQAAAGCCITHRGFFGSSCGPSSCGGFSGESIRARLGCISRILAG